MFGQTPRLPLTSDDPLPALEGVSSSEIMANNLNAVAAAKEAFIKAEISSKLRKALKHPVRSYTDAVYKPGDLVYYKICHGSKKSDRWEGPVTVIGVEGKSNLVLKVGTSIIEIDLGTVQVLVIPFNLNPTQHI